MSFDWRLPRLILFCALALVTPQCGSGAVDEMPLFVTGWTESRSLNESVVIDFSADLDLLLVTEGAVRVVTDEGTPLAHQLKLSGHQLEVTLLLDEALVQDPPGKLLIRLAGWPSLQALRSHSGASMAEARWLEVTLEPRLSYAGLLELKSINGRSPHEQGPVPYDGVIALSFEGVVAPNSVSPASCPLFPVAEGLQLKPVLPDTRWSLVGSRSEVLLRVPPESGSLELIWKRIGLRGLDGRSPEGPLVVTLSKS